MAGGTPALRLGKVLVRVPNGRIDRLGCGRARAGQGAEHLFAGAATGTFPVVGQVLKPVPAEFLPFLSPLAGS